MYIFQRVTINQEAPWQEQQQQTLWLISTSQDTEGLRLGAQLSRSSCRVNSWRGRCTGDVGSSFSVTAGQLCVLKLPCSDWAQTSLESYPGFKSWAQPAAHPPSGPWASSLWEGCLVLRVPLVLPSRKPLYAH